MKANDHSIKRATRVALQQHRSQFTVDVVALRRGNLHHHMAAAVFQLSYLKVLSSDFGHLQ